VYLGAGKRCEIGKRGRSMLPAGSRGAQADYIHIRVHDAVVGGYAWFPQMWSWLRQYGNGVALFAALAAAPLASTVATPFS
jgi:hypothetical protein